MIGIINFVKSVWADALYYAIIGGFVYWMLSPLMEFWHEITGPEQ